MHKMYTIKADTSKNRLYITIDGTITKEELSTYTATLKENTGMLKSGFTALLDLRKASVFDQETMKELQNTKEIAVKAGLSKSAMVVESPTLKMQMNRNFKDVGPQDRAFNDVAEAEKFLEE